jgi:hypothetical protein
MSAFFSEWLFGIRYFLALMGQLCGLRSQFRQRQLVAQDRRDNFAHEGNIAHPISEVAYRLSVVLDFAIHKSTLVQRIECYLGSPI